MPFKPAVYRCDKCKKNVDQNEITNIEVQEPAVKSCPQYLISVYRSFHIGCGGQVNCHFDWYGPQPVVGGFIGVN